MLQNTLSTALTPIINALSVTGIVHIPGMMTGQLLSGQSPGFGFAVFFLVILFVHVWRFLWRLLKGMIPLFWPLALLTILSKGMIFGPLAWLKGLIVGMFVFGFGPGVELLFGQSQVTLSSCGLSSAHLLFDCYLHKYRRSGEGKRMRWVLTLTCLEDLEYIE